MNRSLVSALAFIASIVVSNTAFAKPPSWVDPDKGKIKAGEKVSVRLVADEQGSFTAPPGWTTKWTQTRVGGDKIPCAPDRPETCGVWVASATLTSDTTATFSYVPPTGGASNHTVSVSVEALPPVVPPQPAAPPGGWYPAERGAKLETRVDDLEKAKQAVSLYFHYQMVPNIPTTTSVGHGLILGGNALLVNQGPAARFALGAKFGWMRTNIPMELDMRPIITEGSEDRITAALTAAWAPCAQLDGRDFFCANVGALLGAQFYWYNSTFNRAVRDANGDITNVEFTRERFQPSFMLGPEVSFSIKPTPNLGFGLGFSLPIDVTSVSRVIGEGTGQGGNVQSTSTGSPQANPTFHGGVNLYF